MHERLFQIVKRLPTDYAPYGQVERDREDGSFAPDCSAGCKFALPLAGDLGYDWVVCTNPESPRVGLLTFEHQGCLAFSKR
jgi:hypothetical protein